MILLVENTPRPVYLVKRAVNNYKLNWIDTQLSLLTLNSLPKHNQTITRKALTQMNNLNNETN